MEVHHAIALGIFLAFVLIMLAVDLLVLHRKPHAIQMKEAALGAAVPVVVALLFMVAIFFAYEHHYLELGKLPAHVSAGSTAAEMYPQTGRDAAILFLTGYVVEVSLSADNVFLFIILMNFFRVPREYQHRVLFWGILGALAMRGAMIAVGGAVLTRFEWVIYLFGAFLIITGIKMLFASDAPKDPSKSLAVRMVRKLFPFKEGYDGKNFFTRVDGKRVGTTLLLVLVCIELTDLIFALDSIPAIYGITRDWFIVFTSNVFAIMGLRSMYFLLAGIMDKFHLLRYGLAVVLGFVGVKMVLPGLGDLYSHFTAGPEVSWGVNKYLAMAVIVLSLGVSIMASLMFPSKSRHENPLQKEPALAE